MKIARNRLYSYPTGLGIYAGYWALTLFPSKISVLQ